MKLSFKDGSELEVQSVTESGNSLQVSIVNQALENLVAVFSNPQATGKMITDTGEVFEGYTEYQGINVAPGMIFNVMIYSNGKTPEERITNVEEETNQNAEQMTQAQEAICELYEMVLGGVM